MGNISVEELRHKIMLRLLLKKLTFGTTIKEKVKYDQLSNSVVFAANEILREMGYSDIWARKRGKRIFLFYETYHRIICEIGIDAICENDLCRRPNLWLVNLHGIIPNQRSFNNLISETAKLGVRIKRH